MNDNLDAMPLSRAMDIPQGRRVAPLPVGKSLPMGRFLSGDERRRESRSTVEVGPSVEVCDDDAGDQVSSSWPPKPSVELISRYAHRKEGHKMPSFLPWDCSELKLAVETASAAFKEGKGRASKPEREGVCGTYFISRVQSSADVLGVFKPEDEEAGDDSLRAEPEDGLSALQQYLGRSSAGFRPGDGCYKEVAAYLLDHKRFAGVPQTALARCDVNLGQQTVKVGKEGSRMGAFQVYQPNCGDADDFGPGVFARDAVHRIAIFDLRVLNCDRHGGNILVVNPTEGGAEKNLVPIDHGFILPENVGTMGWPVWMDWPQAREQISAEQVRYVDGLDAKMDARILSDELERRISQASLMNLRLGTALLQKGLRAGLTLYEMGTMVYSRGATDERSILERIVTESIDAGVAREGRFNEGNDLFEMEELASESGEETSNWSETTEDYIFKYASRLLDDHVKAAISVKVKATVGRRLLSGTGRVRSIPEFGTSLKPCRMDSKRRAALSRSEDGSSMAKAPIQRFSPSAVTENNVFHE